ncbi:MAG: hypothetical protein ACKOW9_05510 [Candidatus Paceibacterota bacterium]
MRLGRSIVVGLMAYLVLLSTPSSAVEVIDFGATHELNQPGFYDLDGRFERSDIKLIDLEYNHEVPLTGNVVYEGGKSRVFTPELPYGSYELRYGGKILPIEIVGRYKYDLGGGSRQSEVLLLGGLLILLFSLVLLLKTRGKARIALGFGVAGLGVLFWTGANGALGSLPSIEECNSNDLSGEAYLQCIMPRAYEVAESKPDRLGEFLKGAENSSRCHDISHIIGFELFRKDLSLEGAYQRASNVCGLGLIHGSTEAIAVYSSDEDYPGVIKEFCGKFTDEYVLDLCLHGGGHATVMRTGGDVVRALELCDYVAGGDISCISPALMEWAVWYLESPDKVAAKERLRVPDEPFSICLSVAGESRVRAGCYEGLSMLYQDKVEGLITWCNERDESFGEECMESLGKNAFYFIEKGREMQHTDAGMVGNLCKRGGSEKAVERCIWELARVVSLGGNYSRGESYCRVEEEMYRDLCLEAVRYAKDEEVRLSNG